ncbi:hypothetical protein NOR_07967 [Metarhizium rileyi]|uniref:RNase H type-1 domain-containing protein n=1 Tax=Metarhizium rileyi (strain RCEF 4871) TaxID=1649241 RepID=A0A166X3L0_METRR|nr:hypothetical protein NOR_07967 [Metarhizium rileyi RCEF 4871]
MDTIAELPGGQLVCRAHYLVICHKCGVDFTFIEEEEDVWSNSDDDSRDHEQDFPSRPEVSTIEPQHTSSSARQLEQSYEVLASSSLLGNLDESYRDNVKIQFCKIPRELNTFADAAAKIGAQKSEAADTLLV